MCKMNFLGLALTLIAAVSAGPTSSLRNERIIGGSVTSIGNYPQMAAMLLAADGVNFRHSCGGSIINQRHILTAAHCVTGVGAPDRHRVRLGSTNSNSGGVVHNVERITNHPNYRPMTMDSDISIIRTRTTIQYNNNIRAGTYAGANYHVPDNDLVWAAGWGRMSTQSLAWSEQLRHVQLRILNQQTCNQRSQFFPINANMICAGAITSGAGQCTGDSGGPLYHRGTIVGVCSFGGGPVCGDSPDVNVRVSRFISWIQNNSR